MKNAKNPKALENYDTAHKWGKYVENWAESFENYSREIYHALDALKWNKDLSESDHEYWDKRLRKDLWALYIQFRVPIELADDYWTKEARFYDFSDKLKKWEGRIRRTSRVAWATLDEFIKWLKDWKEKELNVDEEKTEQLNIRGYKVILKSGRKGFHTPKETIQSLTKTLEIANKTPFKKHMQQVPIVVDITSKVTLDDGGRYDGRGRNAKLILYSNVFKQNPRATDEEIIQHVNRESDEIIKKINSNY